MPRRLFRLSEMKGAHHDSGSPDTQQVSADGQRYAINAMVSRFTVQAFASGLLSAFGHNPKIAIRNLKGEIQFDPEQIEKSTMHMVVRADSLTVTDNTSDKDRRDIESDMREKVLETAKYPELVYDVSTVSATLVVSGDILRASGEFSLRQTDYSIKPVSGVGGGLKVKDEVKFTFDIAARKLN